MKILLVDDNADQLSIRCLLLRQQGFDTIAAETRQEALALAVTELPDCAIVDLCLPDLQTGFATIRGLREQSRSIRILALTGYAAETWQNAAARQMADEVVVKGSGVCSLLDCLRRRFAELAPTATTAAPSPLGVQARAACAS